MFNFTYFTPTKVVFGKGAENQAGALVAEQGAKKVLIHYGAGSVVRSGLLERVKKSLDAENVAHVELGGVVPNPRLSLVYEGIALCKKAGVDFLLALGGGSVIDSAKAIAYGLANEGDVWDFYIGERKPRACFPVGAVLTIAAAGSEMSNSSVITKEEGQRKCGFTSDLCRPKFAIMNPELTTSLPAFQTACGCTDICMHTMERWFTSGGNMEITDSIAAGLLRTTMRFAKVLRDEPENYEARAEIMWAGSLSHNGLTGCGCDGRGDWATHGLEHELSAMFDVAHGAGLAAIWGSWARYVYKDCLPRFNKFAESVMGIAGGTEEENALAGISAMENFFREINMPVGIKALLGRTLSDAELVELAKRCAKNTGGKRGSAKVLHEADMLEVYKMANY